MLTHPVQWLSDNGSIFAAHKTIEIAVALNLVPRFTPVESPESNGMAEAFVKTFKRDYVRVSPIPNAAAALALIASWMEDYNSVHPHSRLGYRSPREYILPNPLRVRSSGVNSTSTYPRFNIRLKNARHPRFNRGDRCIRCATVNVLLTRGQLCTQDQWARIEGRMHQSVHERWARPKDRTPLSWGRAVLLIAAL